MVSTGTVGHILLIRNSLAALLKAVPVQPDFPK